MMNILLYVFKFRKCSTFLELRSYQVLNFLGVKELSLRSKLSTFVMLMVFSLSGIVVNSFNFDYFVTSES